MTRMHTGPEDRGTDDDWRLTMAMRMMMMIAVIAGDARMATRTTTAMTTTRLTMLTLRRPTATANSTTKTRKTTTETKAEA